MNINTESKEIKIQTSIYIERTFLIFNMSNKLIRRQSKKINIAILRKSDDRKSKIKKRFKGKEIINSYVTQKQGKYNVK